MTTSQCATSFRMSSLPPSVLRSTVTLRLLRPCIDHHRERPFTISPHWREGKPARLTRPGDDEEERIFRQAQLLTAKPVLYVCNVEEESAAEGNAHSARVFEKAAAEGAKAVIVSAAIEAELITTQIGKAACRERVCPYV